MAHEKVRKEDDRATEWEPFVMASRIFNGLSGKS
jgi:hypothetical protein